MGRVSKEIFFNVRLFHVSMNEYEIKRGHFKNVEGKIGDIMKDVFGKVDEVEEQFRSSFGAIKEITASTEGKTILRITATMDREVPAEVAAETIKRYNDFLYRCTGFTSKQRTKRLKTKAKKGLL